MLSVDCLRLESMESIVVILSSRLCLKQFLNITGLISDQLTKIIKKKLLQVAFGTFLTH